MSNVRRIYGRLNDYIGLQRSMILKEQNGEMNISKSSNGGFHLFLTSNKGFTYGFDLNALKFAIDDFELLQNKTIKERKEFVIEIERERLKSELEYWWYFKSSVLNE